MLSNFVLCKIQAKESEKADPTGTEAPQEKVMVHSEPAEKRWKIRRRSSVLADQIVSRSFKLLKLC